MRYCTLMGAAAATKVVYTVAREGQLAAVPRSCNAAKWAVARADVAKREERSKHARVRSRCSSRAEVGGGGFKEQTERLEGGRALKEQDERL